MQHSNDDNNVLSPRNTDVMISFPLFSMQQIWNVLGLTPSGRLVDVLLPNQILIGRTIIVVTFIRRKALFNPLFLVAGGTDADNCLYSLYCVRNIIDYECKSYSNIFYLSSDVVRFSML